MKLDYDHHKIIFILKTEPIRLVDGRYGAGFVDTIALNELIEAKLVNTIQISGMTFVIGDNHER